MERRITFGQWETVCVLITMLTTKTILNFPRILAINGGTGAWLLCIYHFLIVTAIFYIISKLYKRFEGKDLMDIGESIGGKPVKIIVGVILLGFIIGFMSIYLRTYGEEMKVISLSNSPLSFIMMFFIIGAVVSSYLGLEAIMRIQAFVIPVAAAVLAIFTIALLPQVDFSNFTPILGPGAKVFFGKSTYTLAAYSELIFLFLLTPFIKNGGEFKKVGYKAITISALMFLFITVVFTGIYPYPSVMEEYIPGYELGRIIGYGRFLQRFESVFIIIWALIGFMYLSFIFYFIVHVFRKTFDLQYQRPLILPFAILVFSISFLFERLSDIIDITTPFRVWSIVVLFCITIILLILGRFIGKGKNKKEKRFV